MVLEASYLGRRMKWVWQEEGFWGAGMVLFLGLGGEYIRTITLKITWAVGFWFVHFCECFNSFKKYYVSQEQYILYEEGLKQIWKLAMICQTEEKGKKYSIKGIA